MMKKNKILNITIPTYNKLITLEQIKKYLSSPSGFYHIVSLNPENLIVSQKNPLFKQVLETAQIKIIDGVGIVWASRLLQIEVGERLPGVELMEWLIELAQHRRLRVLLIGGKPNLALRLAQCYQQTYPEANFKGDYGIKNIKNPTKSEENRIFSIVAEYKPHIVLAAFGSPEQELWLDRHRDQFIGCLCMGVGGAFDYLSKEITRAPIFIRKLGLEWVFRLITQPWRWRRQLKLITFIYLVIKQKLSRS